MHSTRITKHLAAELEKLDAEGLWRRPRAARRADAVSFCSNDYLGLATRLHVEAPTGAGASRLVDGSRVEHEELERTFASLVRLDSALAFTSGYAANVGVISALAAPNDLIVSDALNHASLIDGIRLSRARVVVVPHNDIEAIGQALTRREPSQRAWVVVESYYSMDADGPDLRALRAVCDAGEAGLIVDEAHALGVLGPEGRGRCAEAGIEPDVLVGTLGKSFGSQGALVAGASVLRDWLWNRARSFVFSTALAPAAAAAGRAAIEESLHSPALRERTLANAEYLRSKLSSLEGLLPVGFGHVAPVIIGDAKRATALSSRLADAGIDVPAIRPPTVSAGTARLRLTATATQARSDLDELLAAIQSSLRAP